jgi:hypothetical protein
MITVIVPDSQDGKRWAAQASSRQAALTRFFGRVCGRSAARVLQSYGAPAHKVEHETRNRAAKSEAN